MKSDAKDMREAKERAARAKAYAEMFPKYVGPHDLKMQDVQWQLEQVKKFNRACAPQKEQS